jgi:hypothetical protein
MSRPIHPYSHNVSCHKNHLGYIIGKGGKVVKSLIRKWNGRIQNIFVKDPEPQFGRPSHHIQIVGEEKAVHILALEINEMIKVSMGRTETKLRCEINQFDKNQQCQHTTNLQIALLQEEIRNLKEETSSGSGWGVPDKSVWKTKHDSDEEESDSDEEESDSDEEESDSDEEESDSDEEESDSDEEESDNTYDIDEYPNAPENWEGPKKMTYLSRYPKGIGKKLSTFLNFSEAVARAEELGVICGGITKTTTGFTLRAGRKLKEQGEEGKETGLCSWVKSR